MRLAPGGVSDAGAGMVRKFRFGGLDLMALNLLNCGEA
jgi:hypothetical protein